MNRLVYVYEDIFREEFTETKNSCLRKMHSMSFLLQEFGLTLSGEGHSFYLFSTGVWAADLIEEINRSKEINYPQPYSRDLSNLIKKLKPYFAVPLSLSQEYDSSDWAKVFAQAVYILEFRIRKPRFALIFFRDLKKDYCDMRLLEQAIISADKFLKEFFKK